MKRWDRDAQFKSFVYDGDTPQDARRAIRNQAQAVMTNPDMLHAGILPHHTRWASLFENLRYVVLDELHTYRGVFGSHVANVLRRLKRIAEFYHARPQFLCCSATHRQSRRAGHFTAGAPGRGGDRKRGACRGKILPVLQPARGQPATWASAAPTSTRPARWL